MKKNAKISLGIIVIIAIISLFSLRTSLIIKSIKKQIKPGQSVAEVMDVLNGAGKIPDLCCWQIQGSDGNICSNAKNCEFPDEKIQLNKIDKEIQLTVLFMGPGFMHNDFHVTFTGDGLVDSISDLKQWD